MDIDFDDAPHDPIERLMWLSGARQAFQAQVEAQWRIAYFEARQQGQFDAALALRYHSAKRALAWTRAENEARGRTWRWGDGR